MAGKIEDGVETHKSYCRFCHAYCAMDVDVKDGEVVAVRGDATDPIYGGYTCIKGRQLPEALQHPNRLRNPLKRNARGDFEEISLEQALDEIAQKVGDIISAGGPNAIASYCGTAAFQDSAAIAMAKAWHASIGSLSYYSSITIDQPGKSVAPLRVGSWPGGLHGFQGSDVALIIGNNPVVSQYAPFGSVPAFNPSRIMNDEVKRGLKMIVVDPRRTEIAQKAHLHLQVRPGEDPTFLAGIIHIILAEDLHDAEFCTAHVTDLEGFRAAVADFTPDYVAHRCGIAKDDLIEAARVFGRAGRGVASAGTGPDMAPRGMLTEHLIYALNLMCGRVNKEGERVPNGGILGPPITRRAATRPPMMHLIEGAPKSRIRGLTQFLGEMPTATLADEMLLEGEGQVRGLINLGGNPVVAWPDQEKVVRALKGLDLLVSTDIRLAATSKLAHYVLPGKMSFERDDITLLNDIWYEQPYAHYAPKIVEAPGEMIEDWEIYWHIASRLGHEVSFNGGVMPIDAKPTKQEMLELQLKGSRVPLADIVGTPGGQVFEDAKVYVQPPKGDEAPPPMLELAGSGAADELAEVRAEPLDGEGRPKAEDGFSHLLISRRLKHVYNSAGHDLKALAKKGTTNPAFINPDDLAALGIESGELVEVQGRHGTLIGVAEAAKDVRPGVISMAHAFGTLPDSGTQNGDDVRAHGASTNRLLSADEEYCPISGIPRQSAIPVNVKRAEL